MLLGESDKQGDTKSEISLTPGTLAMSLGYEPTTKTVWCGTTDRKVFIHVYNTNVPYSFCLSQSKSLVKHIQEGHKKKVNAFEVTDGKVWSAGDDNTICIWNAAV